jgi:flagellar hook-associated protein 3 FlgL
MSTYISTNYLATALTVPVMQAQSQLSNDEIESSTGQYADLGLQLGEQNGYELSLKNQNDLLTTLTSSNGIATANLTATQNALDSIRTAAQSSLSDLATAIGTTSGATLQSVGESGLQQLISTTNTSGSSGYLFGGINSSQAPLNDYYSTPTSSAKAAIDQAFQTTFGFGPNDPQAANVTAAQMQSFLSGPFAAQFEGANWTTNWSTASSTNTSAEIAPGQTIDTSTNANQTGFQQLAQGYTMLSEFAGTKLSSAAQGAVSSAASTLLTSGMSSTTATEANVGTAQSAITDANNAMSSQMTILQTQIGNMDDVSADTVATQISLLQTQIQTAYELTSRIHTLSLAQYLPTS